MRFFKKKKRQSSKSASAGIKAKRVLIVGSDKHTAVKCVQWDAKKFPNVADYDAVIVNPASLAPKMEKAKQQSIKSTSNKFPELWDRLRENIDIIRNGLLTLLESGGEVYAIICPEERISLEWGHSFHNQMTNYWWVPLPFEKVPEEGETQSIDDTTFAKYMDLVKWWALYLKLPENDRALEGLTQKYGEGFLVELIQEPIARNRYGRQIASRLKYQLYSTRIVERDWLDRPLREAKELKMVSGPLILLPMPTEVSDRDAVNIILENFFGLQQKTLPPQWIEEVDIPGIPEIKFEVENKYHQIEQLKTEIKPLLQRKEELEKYKQLLFETGTPLEEICKQTLQTMGCNILPADLAEEDFIVEFEGQQAIVEVKGNTKSISLSNLSQLGRYREDYLIERGEDKKSILIGNAWRLLPLDERGKSNSQVPFPENVVSYATKRNIALISSIELFQAHCSLHQQALR